MTARPILLFCAFALTLAACGKKETAPPAKAASASISSPSPLDKPFALKGGKAVDVDALLSLFPDDVRPTYVKADYDPKLGATVVTGLKFKDKDGEGAASDSLSVVRAELYGVDLDAVSRIKGANSAADDAPLESVFEKVRLFGVEPLKGADKGTTIGAIQIDRMRLRRGAFKSDADDNPAVFFNAFDAAGIYFKDIVVRPESKDGSRDGNVSFRAPDLRLVGIGGGKLGALIMRNAEYQIDQPDNARAAIEKALGPVGAALAGPLRNFVAPDRQRVVVKSLEWRAIDASGLMSYGLKKEKPPMSARNLLNLGTVDIQGVDTYLDGRKAATVAQAAISAMEFQWLIPSKIRSETKGAQYDLTAYLPPTEQKAIAALKSHGLSSVRGSGTLAWDWDSTKGGAQLKTGFTTDKLADIQMDAAFSGLQLSRIEAAADAGVKNAQYKVGSLNGFGLTIVDKKLLDAMFDIAAIEMGGTGAELRASTPATIRLGGAAVGAAHPKFAAYIDAIANFVGEGGTLEISARPRSPVPFETLAALGGEDLQALPDLINLEVVHKPKR